MKKKTGHKSGLTRKEMERKLEELELAVKILQQTVVAPQYTSLPYYTFPYVVAPQYTPPSTPLHYYTFPYKVTTGTQYTDNA